MLPTFVGLCANEEIKQYQGADGTNGDITQSARTGIGCAFQGSVWGHGAAQVLLQDSAGGVGAGSGAREGQGESQNSGKTIDQISGIQCQERSGGRGASGQGKRAIVGS
jgi:hypothetical protein